MAPRKPLPPAPVAAVPPPAFLTVEQLAARGPLSEHSLYVSIGKCRPVRDAKTGRLRPIDPKYKLLAEAIRRSPTNRIILDVAKFDAWIASGPAYEPRARKSNAKPKAKAAKKIGGAP